MNAVVYCRVSSKEQVEGTSLGSQRQACEDYAKHNRITIQRVFVEEGESAKFADRTQLAELLSFCRDHKNGIDMLLVWKLDRFARNVSDHFSIKALLLKYGVRVVSVTEPIDAKPEGKLLETILAGFAQFDNDIRALRTVQGMKRKLQEGIWPWQPPLGYATPTSAGDKKTAPDEPKPPLFGQLQRAWRAFATGTYTKAEIRRLMATWGIVTDRGKPYSPQSIDRLFQNPFYAGVLVDPWSHEHHHGRHVPLVTMEEFARVQTVISKRNRARPHAAICPALPLRGIAHCSHCRKPLTGGMSRGHGGRYPYYQCRTASCPKSTYAAGPVHAEFEEHLGRIALRESLAPALRDTILAAYDERAAHAAARKASHAAKRAELDRRMSALIDMRAGGLLTDAEFLDKRAALEARRAALDGAEQEHHISRAQLVSSLAAIIAPLSNLPRTWRALNPEDRQRFNRMLIPGGFVIGACRTSEKPLIFSVFGAFANPNAPLVPPPEEVLNRLEAEIIEFADFLADVVLPEKLSQDQVRQFPVRPDLQGQNEPSALSEH